MLLWYVFFITNDIHSFKLIKYIKINVTKNVKSKFASKLTTFKLITYNGKIPTNNMIKSKSQEYSWFRICNVDVHIIDWKSDQLKLIFQYERNEHCNKTWNQTTSHKTTNNTKPHSKDEITKKITQKKTFLMCGNHLFKLKEIKIKIKIKIKRCRIVILGQKRSKIIFRVKEKENMEREVEVY